MVVHPRYSGRDMEGIRNGKSSPVNKRQKAPCFAYNRSPMESMIGSGKKSHG